MTRVQKDEGLIIKKKKLLNGQVMVTIFSLGSGKLVLSAFGIKKLTSKRLSHFEIGNYISFNYTRKGDYLTLGETELQYGHSDIKRDEDKLAVLYKVLFVLNKILPEEEPENSILSITLQFLREMNKDNKTRTKLLDYFSQVLVLGGFIDEETRNLATFDPIHQLENIVGQKIELN